MSYMVMRRSLYDLMQMGPDPKKAQTFDAQEQ